MPKYLSSCSNGRLGLRMDDPPISRNIHILDPECLKAQRLVYQQVIMFNHKITLKLDQYRIAGVKLHMPFRYLMATVTTIHVVHEESMNNNIKIIIYFHGGTCIYKLCFYSVKRPSGLFQHSNAALGQSIIHVVELKHNYDACFALYQEIWVSLF